MLHWICKNLAWLILRVFFRLRAEGREHIPRHGGFILAGNHVSYLDPLVFGSACPRALYYMARDTLFRRPLFAWFLRRIHAFPLKRRAADFEAIRKGLRFLEAGEGLLIFPEGTRQVGGRAGRAFAGVGFLARKAGVPVVPAYVSGSDKALPKATKKVRLSPIRVVYGPAIPPPAGEEVSDVDHSRRVMEAILALKSPNDT